MLSRPSYLCNGNLHTWKFHIYIETGPALGMFGCDDYMFVLRRWWRWRHLYGNVMWYITVWQFETRNKSCRGRSQVLLILSLASLNCSATYVFYSSIAMLTSLQWRHNGCDSVSNPQPHHCLLNRIFRHRSNKTSKLRVTGLCAGKSPGTGEFPAQMTSNAENVSI